MVNKRYLIRFLLMISFISIFQMSYAFFPSGGFDAFNVLRLARWPFYEFDTNNDGKILTGEGIGIYIEEGKRGFTDEEIEKVKEALKVWEDVPTSYACFRIAGYYQDPLSLTTPDALPTISLYVTSADDTGEDVEPDEETVDVGGGILSVTLTLFSATDTVYEHNGQVFPISAGTIIDRDIVVSATAHRYNPQSGEEPLADLKGTLVHEIGHFLGLDHTPLNNLRAIYLNDTDELPSYLIENPVVWMTMPNGRAQFVGATPTMFPIYFEVETINGEREDGAKDLAPDDISGISWLYPRGAQENFFDINHEARSKTRRGTGIPSIPLPGGHVVAWADVDNSPDTPRVPLFSTMVGLYEPLINKQLQGKFSLIGLWKTLEVPGRDGELFTPSYTLTLSALNGTGLNRQAPEGITPSDIDSLQGPNSYSTTTRTDTDYQTSFISEVFHEEENVLDVSNNNIGTPLVWSFTKNTVISSTTGKTLSRMRTHRKPMFGDPNDVCPLNVIEVNTGGAQTTTTTPTGTEGGGTTTGTTTGSISLLKDVRSFRDHYLMNSEAGVAVVDIYYSLAPAISKVLINSELARRIFTKTVYSIFGAFHYGIWRYVLGLLVIAILLRRIRFMRVKRANTKTIIVILLSLSIGLALNAHGRIAFMNTAELVEKSDAVVAGKIVSMNSYMTGNLRIYTDVELKISESIKGSLNIDSSVIFTIPGGKVNGYVMTCSEMPEFKVDEEVVVYLRELPKSKKWTLYAGTRSVTTVSENPITGKLYVKPYSEYDGVFYIEDKTAINKSKSSTQSPDESNQYILFDDYISYLKDLANRGK
ncbi:MAG TPA: hypothetical protein PK813_04365 [Candidatus Hydrogenedens sp.]|nr:hypothetical protein [Candidatus Hydrogenedens sp.]